MVNATLRKWDVHMHEDGDGDEGMRLNSGRTGNNKKRGSAAQTVFIPSFLLGAIYQRTTLTNSSNKFVSFVSDSVKSLSHCAATY